MRECFISVDVETAGPSPDRYALLSIGAVPVDSNANRFYSELRPDREEFDAEALSVHGLTFEQLSAEGKDAAEAMRTFEAWVLDVAGARQPVFVAYNAPFDWMFINVYFHRYLGRNPFGHSALDMKALYMGVAGASWLKIRHSALASRYGVRDALIHNALADAEDQALLFKGMMDEAQRATRR